jgi:hypothetical protein
MLPVIDYLEIFFCHVDNARCALARQNVAVNRLTEELEHVSQKLELIQKPSAIQHVRGAEMSEF